MVWVVAPAGSLKRLADGLDEYFVILKTDEPFDPTYDKIPWLVTQYLPDFPRTVAGMQVAGCPAKVAVDVVTLMP